MVGDLDFKPAFVSNIIGTIYLIWTARLEVLARTESKRKELKNVPALNLGDQEERGPLSLRANYLARLPNGTAFELKVLTPNSLEA